MPVADEQILQRVAHGLRASASSSSAAAQPASPDASASGAPTATVGGSSSQGEGSILAQAAAVYGAKPERPEATPGTGFDPVAAALFEALVEGAFLVAHADGVVDDEERAAFEQVVVSAAGAGLDLGQVQALLSDLGEALQEDGVDCRIDVIAKNVSRPEHRAEVLRVAALVAQVSGGVSDAERRVMTALAAALGLSEADVDRATDAAKQALSV